MARNSHILNASSNLLGIALVIVTGIHISSVSSKSFADETALFASLLLAMSCVASYLSIRRGEDGDKLEDWADRIFLVGLFALVAAVSILAFGIN